MPHPSRARFWLVLSLFFDAFYVRLSALHPKMERNNVYEFGESKQILDANYLQRYLFSLEFVLGHTLTTSCFKTIKIVWF